MLNIILFDSDARNHLLPLTATRPMGELRVGILTLREKWERSLKGTASYITQEYLQEKYPIRIEEENIIVNAGILPNEALCRRISELEPSEALLLDGELVAARLNETQFEHLIGDEEVHSLQGVELDKNIPVVQVKHLWELTLLGKQAIADDFALIAKGRKSHQISATNHIIGPTQNLFVEEGVRMECCTLNVHSGPIYIGKNVEIMEGAMLRGPVSIGEGSILKMGAKIYGPTTIGPHCRVGGEVTRSILMGYTNKAHDGFLGDGVLGEWCNIGADSNNSNLKNNYGEVKLWDYHTKRFEKTGQQFVGLIMGDHSKCGINTMFNTGTVVGIFANVYGAGFLRNFIPDFAWGGDGGGFRTYKFTEACETAANVMARRNQQFTELDKAILYHVYDRTNEHRTWEK
ncbi:MAG: GlmU family protein [Saprospiraceae bacterium]|nr:GlmU family protein [Saprospiraceae bacterium]MCB0543512.1 GlmU family protein [Saprospiraceae bacterium]MCB0576652.1 GlmU family protein [Saprospiraceae bacterium]